ncbi:hypothetical protein HYY73_02025 [Candidatus Woesearchaeota archaeon]|nr:hypothetical protein [Candidatus Woesearchaeota archaeon]
MEALAKLAVRQKLSDKAGKLAEEAQKRGRLTSSDVDKFFGTSRGWALHLMEKVGSQPGFRFVKGESASKRPSVLVYDPSLIVQDQYKAIDKLIAEKPTVIFYEIMDALGVDSTEVRLLLNDYVEVRSNCKVVDNNKLVRKS